MTLVATKRPCEGPQGRLCFVTCPECRETSRMNVTIYTKDNCSWCVKAKELMNKLNIHYTELKLDRDFTRDELRILIGEHLPLTVPQIFIDNHRIGGYEDFADYCDNHGLSANA